MSIRPEFWLFLAVVATVAYACRAGGFFLMRYVPRTARLDVALRATPLAVMIGITAPAALRGGIAEWVAMAVAITLARLTGRDITAALIGVAAVAVMRTIVPR